MDESRIERRKHKRVDAQIPVTVLPIEKSKEEFSAVTRGIGTGGICIRLNQHLQEKDFYLFKFQLPVDGINKQLEVMGKVVWGIEQPDQQLHYRIGVQFVSIRDETKDAIDHYIRRQATNSN